MESVKVDAQKLQILNERLAQTIEALNQVRLSMHGLGGQPTTTGPVPFTPPFGYAYPYAAPFVPSYGYGYGTPYAGISHTPQTAPWMTTPSYGYGYGTPSFGYGTPSFGPGTQFGAGISHTPAQAWPTTPWQTTMQTPWQQTPWQTMQTPWQTVQTPWQQTPQWTTGNGISHSTWETPPSWQQQMPRQWTWAW